MKYLAMIFLFFVLSTAHAAKPVLDGGDVIAQTMCSHGKQVYNCVAVLKEKKLYVVMIDKKGEHSIYDVTGDEPVLLWSRDSV